MFLLVTASIYIPTTHAHTHLMVLLSHFTSIHIVYFSMFINYSYCWYFCLKTVILELKVIYHHHCSDMLHLSIYLPSPTNFILSYGTALCFYKHSQFSKTWEQTKLKKKNPPTNVGDSRNMGSIPGLGRSPGGGHGNPLQYFSLENPHGQRTLVGYSLWESQRVRHEWAT